MAGQRSEVKELSQSVEHARSCYFAAGRYSNERTFSPCFPPRPGAAASAFGCCANEDTHDIEQELGLIGGNIYHGELGAGQLFHMRPSPGYANFRTPIRGLYHASSATHGGGGVNGIPGVQAFRQAKRDGVLRSERARSRVSLP